MPVATHPTARIIASLAVLGALSACASQPQLTAQQETTQYLSRAGRNYTPPGPSSDPWGPYIKEASAKFDVPERWIREVMRQESGGRLYNRNGDLITSHAGAMGLMQVMPGTYDELRGRYPEILGPDPFDPRNNIHAGTAYIREMYDIYGSPGFLAAYNAGPGRLDDHLTRNRTLPEETRKYVAAIGPRIAGSSPNTRSPGEQFAMNAMPMQIPDGPRYPNARYRAPEPSVALAQAYVSGPSPAVARALNPVPASASFVASAEPQRIRLAPQPAFEPVPEPVQVAQVDVPNRIRLSPQPAYEPAPVPMQLQPAEPLPLPPAPVQVAAVAPRAPEPRFTPAQQFAALAPLPVPPAPAPAPSQRSQAMAALVPASPARPAFSLVSAANAAPAARVETGSWAVQVGAFANPGLASSATVAAKGQVRELGTARTQVAGVRQGAGTLYRARLTGLSHSAATQACEKLARARQSCMLVSPDAQS